MKRRTAREKALQTLFSIDIGKIRPQEAYEHMAGEGETDDFFKDLVFGTCERLPEIDRLIEEHLEHWKLERLPAVERNLLRMAVYEIVYREDIPAGVAVNEAVEVAKKYGDEKSGRFVNGVLAKIIDRRGE